MISILVVCTGNIFRSPMGEFMLRRALEARGLDDGVDFHIESVGTHVPHDGATGISRGAAVELTRRGMDSSRHRARELTFERIDAADLVLVMEVAHRKEVVARHFEAADCTFLVPEATALARGVPGDPRREIDDPIGATGEVIAAVASELEAAVESIADDLTSGESRLLEGRGD